MRLLDRLFDHDRAVMLIVLIGSLLPVLVVGTQVVSDIGEDNNRAVQQLVDEMPMPAFDIDAEIDKALQEVR